jgi:hypothetical protein
MTEFTNQSTQEVARFVRRHKNSHELIQWARGRPATVSVIGIGTGNHGAVIAKTLEDVWEYLNKNPDFLSYIVKCESGVSNEIGLFTSGASDGDRSRMSELNVIMDRPSEGATEQRGTQLVTESQPSVVKEQWRVGRGYVWIHLGKFRSIGVIDNISYRLKLGRKKSSNGLSTIALRVEHLAPRSQKVRTFYLVSDSFDSCLRSIACYPNLPYESIKQHLLTMNCD